MHIVSKNHLQVMLCYLHVIYQLGNHTLLNNNYDLIKSLALVWKKNTIFYIICFICTFICQVMAGLYTLNHWQWTYALFTFIIQLTEEFLDIVDNILDVDQDILQESQETANTSAM